MENELINVMTNEDLEAMKVKYPGNASVVHLVDGILATRKAEEDAKQVKANFVTAIDALLVVKEYKIGKNTITTGLPQPPSDVHNLYLAWREVETPSGEEVATEVVKADGTKVVEMRQPTTKEFKWIAEVNKGFQVGKSTTTSGDKSPSKRAITVYKRDGLTNKLVGNFKSGSDACKHLKIDVAGDSATRVLLRDGYIIDAYAGNDFTA